jgi:hypothetical protein
VECTSNSINFWRLSNTKICRNFVFLTSRRSTVGICCASVVFPHIRSLAAALAVSCTCPLSTGQVRVFKILNNQYLLWSHYFWFCYCPEECLRPLRRPVTYRWYKQTQLSTNKQHAHWQCAEGECAQLLWEPTESHCCSLSVRNCCESLLKVIVAPWVCANVVRAYWKPLLRPECKQLLWEPIESHCCALSVSNCCESLLKAIVAPWVCATVVRAYWKPLLLPECAQLLWEPTESHCCALSVRNCCESLLKATVAPSVAYNSLRLSSWQNYVSDRPDASNYSEQQAVTVERWQWLSHLIRSLSSR